MAAARESIRAWASTFRSAVAVGRGAGARRGGLSPDCILLARSSLLIAVVQDRCRHRAVVATAPTPRSRVHPWAHDACPLPADRRSRCADQLARVLRPTTRRLLVPR